MSQEVPQPCPRPGVALAVRVTLLQFVLVLLLSAVANAHWSNAQPILDRTLSVQLSDVTLRQALEQIEKKVQLPFVYSSLIVSGRDKVSLTARDETLSSLFDRLLRPRNIGFAVVSNQVVLSKLPPAEAAQPRAGLFPGQLAQPITGRVTDQLSGEPMPGVSVSVKGTTTGTTTGPDGTYSLSVPDGNTTLVFSFIGYVTDEVALGNRTAVDVSLSPDIQSLSEMVVVGYGTLRKSDVTGVVSSAELTRVSELPIPSVDQVLSGRVAGVQINQSSGQAGAGTSIRIRGGNSINSSNEPLFVVDGFPIANDNGALAAGGPAGLTNSLSGNPGQGNPGGALNWLNPADIESIEILKDASATAIYGSRGANGVVIVTTKKGKSGQARLTFNTSYGFSEFNDSNIKLMSGSQFAQYDNLNRAGLKRTTYYKDTTVNGKLFPRPDRITQNTNWLDAVTRRGITQNYSLGFTGGREVMYSGSVSLFNQQTPLKGSEFQRANFRLSLQTNLTPWLSLDNSFSYTVARTDNSPSDVRDVQKFGLFEAALSANPAEPVYNPDGTLNFNGGAPSNATPGIAYNPLSYASDILNRNSTNTFLNNLSLRAKIIDGLTFEVRGSVFNNSTLRDIYYNSRTTFNGFQVGGLAGKNTNVFTSYLLETFATYSKTIGINNLNAVLGYSYQVSDTRSVVAGSSGFPNDALKNEALNSGSTTYPIQTIRNRGSLVSYFVRVNNVLADKYILTFTARYDGSSNLGADNKFALFPSGAVSWRLSQEDFLKNNAVLSDLRLRVSYGLSGAQAIAPGQSQSFLSTTQYPVGGTVQTGVFQNNLGNPALRWEATAQFNAGLDFGLLQQRFTGSINYYDKTTRDLLQSRPLPANSGFENILTNLGSISNRGVELELRGAVIDKPRFRWEVNLNVARNVQRLVSTGLPGVDTLINSFAVVGGSVATTANIVGQPIGVFYGYRQDGLYTSQAQLDALPGPGGSALGSPRFRDLNGDRAINERDRAVIGDPNPAFTFGVINNFTIGRFDLNFLTQGVVGGNIYNLSGYVLQRLGNQLASANDYYTPTNTTARFPAPGNDAGRNNHSDFSIESATFLRLKSLTLGYNVPLGNLKFLSSVRVYASGANLLTFTGYKGFDPEVNSFAQSNLFRNIDIVTVPLFRTYTLGASIGF